MELNTVKKDEKVVSGQKMKTLLRLLKYLLNYKGLIACVLFVMFFSVGISTINPLLVERAINVHIKENDVEGLTILAITAIILNVIYFFLVKIRMYLMAKMSNDVVVKIRSDLFKHIQTLSFSFFDSRPTGKILARLMGDVNSLKNVLSQCVTTFLPNLVTIIAVVVVMFVKNVRLALASVVSVPLLMAGLWFIQNKSRTRWQNFRTKSSNLNAFVHEDVSGMRVVQSFNAETETRNTFDGSLKEYFTSFKKAVLYADAFNSVTEFSWGIATICLYYTAAKLMGGETIEAGTLIAFGTYISMFWQPIQGLGSFYNQVVTNITAAERIFEIMDTKPEIVDKPDASVMPEIEGSVEFKNVSFAYDEATKVLENVSFKIKPGETIALVGATGAGKTTIVNLISRFYNVTLGNIYIDGHDIEDVTIESLRSQMGVMTQDNFLFTGTIRDNIKYGKLDATDDEMISAAKAVGAHDFIMKLEKGYDTEIKERGAGLSIGQRQLLAFARTMVSLPKILILDEATSSIDTKTELLVQKGIETLLEGRTSFVIAHRLSTIQKADRIFVIENGGIMESGTAAELMAKKGRYYELYMAQCEPLQKRA